MRKFISAFLVFASLSRWRMTEDRKSVDQSSHSKSAITFPMACETSGTYCGSNPYAFKRVYGREENRDVLESILEVVLADTEFGTVTDLEILNPFNERDTIDDKLSVVDVRARQ